MNKIHKQLVKKYGRSFHEIVRICNSPFKFTMDVMNDPTDDKPILMHHLVKFKKKNRFKHGQEPGELENENIRNR